MTCRRDATATRDLSELCQPGNIGGTLAAGGQDFLLASRDQETARKIAADLGGHAEAVSVDEAV
jgi:hypothetical protein